MNNQDLSLLFKKYPYLMIATAVFVLFFMLWMVTPNDSIKQDKKISQLERKLAQYDLNQKQGKTLEKDLRSIEKHMEHLGARLMDPSDTTRTLSFFIDLEGSTGLKMSDPVQLGVIRVPNTPIKNKLNTPASINMVLAQYEIKLEGTLFEILNFVESAQTEDYFIRFTQLKLFRDAETSNGQLEAIVALNILGKQNI